MSETLVEPAERDEIARVLAGIPGLAVTQDVAIERIGGLTNRNYKITLGPERYVLRLAGAGTSEYIDRAAEAHNARVAAAAGVNAEVLHFEIADGTMLARYIDDSLTMSEAAFKDLARVERAARAFRRMHRLRAAVHGPVRRVRPDRRVSGPAAPQRRAEFPTATRRCRRRRMPRAGC